MDSDGVDEALLLPNDGLYLTAHDGLPGEVKAAYARAYNQWVAELAAGGEGRLHWGALLCRENPREAVRELERAIGSGARALVMRPNVVAGVPVGHEDLIPIYALCEEASVPVVLHEGSHAWVPTAGEHLRTRFGQHAASHPLEAMLALASLLEGGVFHRFEGLRWLVTESGCGWFPFWVRRLEREWNDLFVEVARQVPTSPVDALERAVYVAIDGQEPHWTRYAELLGWERLVYGSDHPHPDAAALLPKAISEELTQCQAEMVFADNARRLLFG